MKSAKAKDGPSHLQTQLAYMQATHGTAVVQDIGFVDFSGKYKAKRL